MQLPDTKPGFYYVSVIDGARKLLALGPFENDHAGALASVETVEAFVEKMGDPKSPWYAFGTCRSDVNLGPGKLNDRLGVAAH